MQPTATPSLWRGLCACLRRLAHTRAGRLVRAVLPFAILAFLNLRLAYLLIF